MLTIAGLAGGLAAAGAATAPGISIPCATCAVPVAPPAYEWAARIAHIPASVLFAVAREESGTLLRGRLTPWPWTLNVAGVARRFATREEACAALERALKRVSSHHIDVGLGQIDLQYYGDRVTNPCDLLDPYRNLLLAATILRTYHDAGDDWMVAIGRYHRPAGGPPAAQYRRDVAAQLARVLANAGLTASSQMVLP
jgi:hypothetical protein